MAVCSKFPASLVSESEEELIIECSGLKGSLSIVKCKDGRSKCVKVGGEWLTPCEFERRAGRSSARDWKKSIRYNGKLLKEELERRAGVIKGKREEAMGSDGSVQKSEGGADGLRAAECKRRNVQAQVVVELLGDHELKPKAVVRRVEVEEEVRKKYRALREEKGMKDTNVTNSVSAMRGRV